MDEKLRSIAWANVIVVALFVILIISQASKKFALDEVDFPVLAKAISETGLPYHYRGDTDPRSLGLWHPPLYAHSLAVFVKVFGYNETTVRAFGMCCTLISALLCILIYRELFQTTDPANDRSTLIFLSLFLLHPYTIANATVPDIDSTVLPITMLVFIYGLIRMLGFRGESARPLWSEKNVIFLSALFALNLWAKLTTPLILIPSAFLIFIAVGWSLRRSVSITSAFAVLGGIMFLVTYGIYCRVLALPFDFTFRFLVFSFTKNASSDGSMPALLAGVISHLSYTKQFVNWLGLPFVFALALSSGALIFKRTRPESEKVLLVLAGFGLFVMSFYLSLTGAFGGFFKYPYPAFPILILVITHYMHSHLFLKRMDGDSIRVSFRDSTIQFGHQQIWLFLFCSIAILVCYYQVAVTKDTDIFRDRPVSFVLIFSIVGIAAAISIVTAKISDSQFLAYGLSILLAMMVGTQFGISRSQAVAAYPTKYNYGQIGFDETVSYLKERLETNEPIWSMKDIGHYANGTYIENYSSIFKKAAEITSRLQDIIKNNRVRYFVVTKGIGQDRVDAYAELKSALETCCVIEREFGNFLIYRAKQHE